MALLRFESHPLWLNLLVFVAGAAGIWIAGTRLSRYADALADRTGVGRAFIGALLLGGITSLPEGVTTLTASAIGSVSLAVNNIFGGVAMQVAVLALADAVIPGRAISVRIRGSSVLLQAALLVLVLTVAAAGMAVGDTAVLGVGAWSSAILVTAILAFFLIHRDRSYDTWEPEEPPPGDADEKGTAEKDRNPAREHSTGRLAILIAASAAAILVAGYAVARSADALAVQTGLGESFVGVLFLAVATSLPEVSTTLAAARMGQFTMAFSNIFGANILDTAVLFLADLAHRGGPALNEVGPFSLVAALLGIVVTTVYLVGLLERRKRVVAGMGPDSLLVLALYMGGMVLLYTMR